MPPTAPPRFFPPPPLNPAPTVRYSITPRVTLALNQRRSLVGLPEPPPALVPSPRPPARAFAPRKGHCAGPPRPTARVAVSPAAAAAAQEDLGRRGRGRPRRCCHPWSARPRPRRACDVCLWSACPDDAVQPVPRFVCSARSWIRSAPGDHELLRWGRSCPAFLALIRARQCLAASG